MKFKYSLLACARWESKYIEEWLNYYKSIGVDHAYLYCNDDSPVDFYEAIFPFAVGKDPFVTFHHCPIQGAQWWMYMHFFLNYKEQTEWICIFDIDEFLALKGVNDIDRFMSAYADKADSIYLNWAFFGNNGFATRPEGSVLLNYTQRQPNLDKHTKHITRSSAIVPSRIRRESYEQNGFLYFNHGWNEETGGHMRRVNVLGDDMSNYYVGDEAKKYLNTGSNTADIYNTALIHHHAFKSEEDFMIRYNRGIGGDLGGQAHWKRVYDSGESKPFLSFINSTEDLYLRTYWLAQHNKALSASMFPPSEFSNLALRKPATQSSVPSWHLIKNPSEHAAGAVNGFIGADYSFHTDYGDSWWQVDLEQRCNIREIRIYNRMDNSEFAKRAYRLKLWVGDDGVVFHLLYVKSDETPFGGVDGNPFRWIANQPVAGRYVRVSTFEHEFLHLNQIEVYGMPSHG
jgi:hypothetical protein